MKIYNKAVPVLFAFLLATVFTTGFTFSSYAAQNSEHGEALTSQVWAVQVEVEPGESGSLNQSATAAYGPYDSDVIDGSSDQVKKDSFGFAKDDGGRLNVVKGEEYVGNYFHIDQEVSNTGGTTKRYIDVSSPWTGAYLYEDMTVEGSADIQESFRMDNLGPGIKAASAWFELF